MGESSMTLTFTTSIPQASKIRPGMIFHYPKRRDYSETVVIVGVVNREPLIEVSYLLVRVKDNHPSNTIVSSKLTANNPNPMFYSPWIRLS